METMLNLYDESGWMDAPNYCEGARQKVLMEEKGVKTFLIRFPGGKDLAAHSHPHHEQHFILKGSYLSEGKTWPAGAVRVFKPGEVHGPFTSMEDLEILVLWH